MRPDLEFPYCLRARECASWKIAFLRLLGLFQRAPLIIVARISFHKTNIAREIFLQSFSLGFLAFIKDFRKEKLNFHLHRKISKLLWIRHVTIVLFSK